MGWEIVVGIETHTQLLTRSKIFSGASTDFGAPPNTQASAVDLALPGTLPVLNRAALEHAIRFGLAVNGTINRRSVFARKNYFYPDLPKGYQISQYESPIVQGGELRIGEKVVRLTRAHLEEDAGKSLHEAFSGMTGIDLNRAGTPLLEIVSEPELRGAQEAVAYARTLHALVMWIGICDGNMQEGSFRCDANVSVRRLDEKNSVPAAKSKTSTRSASWSRRSSSRQRARSRSWRTAAGSSRRRGSTTRTATRPAPCAPRKTRRITATFPIRICCRWWLPSKCVERRSRRSLPELPEAKRQRYVDQWRAPAHGCPARRQPRPRRVLRRGASPSGRLTTRWRISLSASFAGLLNAVELDVRAQPGFGRSSFGALQKSVDGRYASAARSPRTC